IKGFDLQDFIKQIQTRQFFALQRTIDKSLNFSRLDAKANIADGVATLDSADIQTADGAIKLAVIIPLTNRSLALSGILTLPEKIAGASEGQTTSSHESSGNDKADQHIL